MISNPIFSAIDTNQSADLVQFFIKERIKKNFDNFEKNREKAAFAVNCSLLHAKMPQTVEQNAERLAELVAGGGLKADTLQRRQRAADEFDRYIKTMTENEKSLMKILDEKDTASLETCLLGYFESFRVSVKTFSGGKYPKFLDII